MVETMPFPCGRAFAGELVHFPAAIVGLDWGAWEGLGPVLVLAPFACYVVGGGRHGMLILTSHEDLVGPR